MQGTNRIVASEKIRKISKLYGKSPLTLQIGKFLFIVPQCYPY